MKARSSDADPYMRCIPAPTVTKAAAPNITKRMIRAGWMAKPMLSRLWRAMASGAVSQSKWYMMFVDDDGMKSGLSFKINWARLVRTRNRAGLSRLEPSSTKVWIHCRQSAQDYGAE